MRNIVITGDFPVSSADFPYHQNVIHLPRPQSETEIARALAHADDYILGGPEYLSADLLAYAPRLKRMVVMGTGTTSFVDLVEATRRGVMVLNTPSMNVDAVTEYTLAMLVTCLARVFESMANLRTGSSWFQTPRPAIQNLKVGIVGMGAIGTQVATELHRRGTREICYYSRSRKPQLEQSMGLRYLPLAELLGYANAICVHVTYNDSSHHLINTQLLAGAAKNLAIFNLSHPSIICPESLRKFLVEQPDAFCFLDGYYREWVLNEGIDKDPHKLLSLPASSFLAASHLAAQRLDTVTAIYEMATRLVNDSLQEAV